MGLLLLLALLVPPLIPFVVIFGLLNALLGDEPEIYRGNPQPPRRLPTPSRATSQLFEPVTPTLAFAPRANAGAGQHLPGALCPICGKEMAEGNHDHGG